MELITLLNMNSGASQVILAAALVGVTIYYAVQTRKTVQALEQQVETLKPIVAVKNFQVPEEPNSEGTYCIHSDLINIGTSVAVNILVEFSDLATGNFIGKSVNSIDFLKPDGEQSTHHIHLSTESFRHLRYSEGHHGLAAELSCVVGFQDVHGKTFKTTQMVFFTKKDRKIVPEPGTLRLL
ncbi:MAG: hypothetical protein AAB536_02370 [Patescibacteria group bacterium]